MRSASSGKRGARGQMAPLAYVIVTAVAAVVVIGIRARTGELAVEDRGLCRSRARWAAESAVARGRAHLGAGFVPGPLQGTLSAAGEDVIVRYALRVERTERGLMLEGFGTCAPKEDREARATVTAIMQGAATRWRIAAWSEGP